MFLNLLLSTKMRKKKFTIKEAARIPPPQALFRRISTEVDVGWTVEMTNVTYKIRFLMKKRMTKRVKGGRPEGYEK